MPKIKVPIATTNKDRDNQQFSIAQLHELANYDRTVYVSVNFNHTREPIGKLVNCTVENNILYATLELCELPKFKYFAVGYTIDNDTGRLNLITIGNTDNPTDQTLVPLEWL